MTLQSDDFFFFVSSWDTHLLHFFSFPICFKCQMAIEWSTLSSSATSQDIRGSASMMALNWLLSASDGRLPCFKAHLQDAHILCKTSWATSALYFHWQFLGQRCAWRSELSPLLNNPFWTQIKKLLEFVFV